MKLIRILTAVCLMCGVGAARANILLNFENLSTNYNADYGAPPLGLAQDIGNHYSPYVAFGPNVQGTSGTSSLPVIGKVGIENVKDGINVLNGPAGINFMLTGALANGNAGVTGFSFWYSSFANLNITAYNGANAIISVIAAADATNGVPSKGPQLFSLTVTGFDHVEIDDGSGLGTFFDIDNLGIYSTNVPDAASSLGLLSMAGVGMVALRRKLASA